MEILFYRYGSICEEDIIDILKQNNHCLDELTKEMVNKNITDHERIEQISSELKKKRYDFVFSINFFPVVSDVCNIFKIPYVCWIVDCPVMEMYAYAVRNPWNRIFVFDYAMYEEFVSENPSCIFYMPLGANHIRIDQVIRSITKEEKIGYAADVSFVGSLYTEKCPYNSFKENNTYLRGYLDGIIQAQQKVYGYNFLEKCITDEVLQEFKEKVPFYYFSERFRQNDKAAMAHLYLGNKVTEQERIHLLKLVSENFDLKLYTSSDESCIPLADYRGSVETMCEMPKVFHLSKINLNLTSKPIRTGLPLRIWDILGAGGFLLTNYQSEIEEYFTVGKELEVFSCEEELLQKIKYYLIHEDQRKKIAECGYMKTKELFSLHHRIEQILATVVSFVSDGGK